METVYLVTSGSQGKRTLQGIFKDKKLADTFAEAFEDSLVEKEFLYTEFPKVYKYECSLQLDTGRVIEINPCTPSVNPVLLTVSGEILYAVGETQAEAQYNAEAYFKKLNTPKNNP